MCKGAAILINDTEILMNKTEASHSKIRADEDRYLKVNVIYDDSKKVGYRIEVDSHGEDQIDEYKKQAYLTEAGKIIPSYLKRLKEYCEEHRGDIFKVLCKNMQTANIKGDQWNIYANINGNQRNIYANINGNQRNNYANIKGDQWNDYAIMRKMFIQNMKVEDKFTTGLIKEFSDSEQEEYTLSKFVKWLLKSKRSDE